VESVAAALATTTVSRRGAPARTLAWPGYPDGVFGQDNGRFPNLIRGLAIARLDQVWCADITEIRLRRDFVYRAVLMDIYQQAIRRWELSANLTEALTVAAPERALSGHTP